MKIKCLLGAAAIVGFIFAPVFAQHGHGGGRSSSMHGGDHSSSGHDKADADHGSGHDANHSGDKSISQKLAANPKLDSKLQSLLPSGTNLQTAASGFKNLGQFVAAVHVSHNLGIPFAQLKCTELATADACPGMTVPSKASHLGPAIQTLKP